MKWFLEYHSWHVFNTEEKGEKSVAVILVKIIHCCWLSEYVATELGVTKEMVRERAGEENFEGIFNEKLEMVATKEDFLQAELYDRHFTPLTPSFQCSR